MTAPAWLDGVRVGARLSAKTFVDEVMAAMVAAGSFRSRWDGLVPEESTFVRVLDRWDIRRVGEEVPPVERYRIVGQWLFAKDWRGEWMRGSVTHDFRGEDGLAWWQELRVVGSAILMVDSIVRGEDLECVEVTQVEGIARTTWACRIPIEVMWTAYGFGGDDEPLTHPPDDVRITLDEHGRPVHLTNGDEFEGTYDFVDWGTAGPVAAIGHAKPWEW